MTKITYRFVLIGVLIGAVFGLLSTCVEPVFARPVVTEWPLKEGDKVRVSTMCDLDGFAEMNIAFQTDMDMDAINDLYNLLLAKGDCVALNGDDTVVGTVVRVGKPIRLKTGATVYAFTLDLGDGAPLVYSFIIATHKNDTAT